MMQKKSIYVAYTGGTIGMQRSENGYIPVSGHLQRQLALMPEFHRPEMPDFTIHEYDPLMDSSDMTRKTGSILRTISKRIMTITTVS